MIAGLCAPLGRDIDIAENPIIAGLCAPLGRDIDIGAPENPMIAGLCAPLGRDIDIAENPIIAGLCAPLGRDNVGCGRGYRTGVALVTRGGGSGYCRRARASHAGGSREDNVGSGLLDPGW
jgi:hypothetical protein